MDIEMGIIKDEDILVKISLKSRCYEFWFIKHPLYSLWLWCIGEVFNFVQHPPGTYAPA